MALRCHRSGHNNRPQCVRTAVIGADPYPGRECQRVVLQRAVARAGVRYRSNELINGRESRIKGNKERLGPMNSPFDGEAFQPQDPLVEDAGAAPSWLGPRRARLTAHRVRHRHPARDMPLVRGVQDSLVRCGLSRTEHTLAGSETVHSPRVVLADVGPPGWVQVDLLAGQSAEDFAAHARAIAQDLDVPEVWVVPLGRSCIRLELTAQRDGS